MKMNNLVIDLSKVLRGKKRVCNLWKGSKNLDFLSMSNASKGKVGVVAVKQYLESQGFEAQEISNQGDILYQKRPGSMWIKAEVKTSKANLTRLVSGQVNEMLWFNQVRPAQEEWDMLFLVGIYPNHVRIWQKTREDFLNNLAKMHSTVKGLSHVGTSDLAQVTLKKNSKIDNFHEWEIVHNDQAFFLCY